MTDIYTRLYCGIDWVQLWFKMNYIYFTTIDKQFCNLYWYFLLARIFERGGSLLLEKAEVSRKNPSVQAGYRDTLASITTGDQGDKNSGRSSKELVHCQLHYLDILCFSKRQKQFAWLFSDFFLNCRCCFKRCYWFELCIWWMFTWNQRFCFCEAAENKTTQVWKSYTHVFHYKNSNDRKLMNFIL